MEMANGTDANCQGVVELPEHNMSVKFFSSWWSENWDFGPRCDGKIGCGVKYQREIGNTDRYTLKRLRGGKGRKSGKSL